MAYLPSRACTIRGSNTMPAASGFVVNIKGKKSNQIVRDALTVLTNLRHRGACGCEAEHG